MSTAANPRANNPQQGEREATGAVTSDSLAAESIRNDEGFAENDASIQSVKGSNSTFNNTDTSGATELQSARDGASREAQDAQNPYPDGNQPDFPGAHSIEGYVGGPSNPQSTQSNDYSGVTGDSFADGTTNTGSSSFDDSKISSGSQAARLAGQSGQSDSNQGSYQSGSNQGSGQSYGSESNDGSSNADIAPNYAATVSGAIQPEGYGKPKGENLTEGGIPETKTFTGNVGGSNDPGRLAEAGFAKINADTAAGIGGKEGTTDSGAFGALDSERA